MNLSQTTSGPFGNRTGANGSLGATGGGGPAAAIDLGATATNPTAGVVDGPELEEEPVSDT